MRLFELDRSGGYIGRALKAAYEAEPERTGLHVSTIIDAMVRRIDPAMYAEEFSETQKRGYMEVGNVVEDLVADWLGKRLAGWEKPKPRTLRGITGSPDGWRDTNRALHEIKACWKSERLFDAVMEKHTRAFDLLSLVGDNLKLYAYVLQLLTYGEMWDADRGYLHILFINGKYPRGAPAPNPRTFVVKWTLEERKANFDRMVQFAIDEGWLKKSEDRKSRPATIDGRVLWKAEKFKRRRA